MISKDCVLMIICMVSEVTDRALLSSISIIWTFYKYLCKCIKFSDYFASLLHHCFLYIKMNYLADGFLIGKRMTALRFSLDKPVLLDKSREIVNHVTLRRYREFFFATGDVAISRLVSRRDAQRSISVTRTIARCTRFTRYCGACRRGVPSVALSLWGQRNRW